VRRYSDHAKLQMIDRQFTEAEVEAVIVNPERGVNLPKVRDRKEHLGYAADGRPMNVVTNRAETVVITVVEQ
jgi:hypothetical protein